MRLAVCALSAVLLSGCSWLGAGGHNGDSYGYQYGHNGAYAGYGANGCAPGMVFTQQQTSYGMSGSCAPGAGYNVAQNGYMNTGYGAQSGMAQSAYGMTGGSQMGAYSAASTTMLSSSAPYGSAVGGGQVINGGVQTVQGAPIYVPQPYAAPYPVPALRGSSYAYSSGAMVAGCCGGGGGGGYGGGAMPFGIELGGGTEFDVGGNILKGKAASPNFEDFALATGEVVAPAVSYNDAFGQSYNIGGGLSYDVSRNTTLLGTVNYSKANGKTFDNGTFQPGTYDALGNFTASGPVEAVTAEFTDLEQISIEGGVRQYMGYNPTLRPYVGASAGFTHNNAVDFTQTSTTLGTFTQPYIEAEWNPTAAGVVGAEMAVGPRAAIGVETGIRWRDNLDTNAASDDRWSIPVSLRGRVAF